MSETADRKPRLALWTLLVVGALVVIALSAHVPLLVRYRRNHAAARAYEAMGGDCGWKGASPSRLLRLLGRKYADLYDRLWRLDLQGTGVTDAGLVHLEGLPGLHVLVLDGTRVTDAGLVHLRGLSALEMLDLDDTEVTDAGLAHLKGLSNLGTLDLNGTCVTDVGVAKLKIALPKLKVER